MKNKIIVGSMIIVLIIGAFIIISNEKSQSEPVIVASFYPLAFFTEEIAHGALRVETITPAGAEPHDYEPTGKQIAMIKQSPLLIVNGGGLEPWAERIASTLSPSTVVIVASEGLATLEGILHDHEEDEHNEDEHNEHNIDPHIWLSPRLAQVIVARIATGLVMQDNKNTSLYETNASSLIERLQALDTTYRTTLSSCAHKKFVTSHAAFGYLAREYGLVQIPITSISPDEEPSPRKLAELSTLIKEHGISYIFTEPLSSPRLAETIAREVGAKILVLNPLEGLSRADIRAGKTYFTEMEANLYNLSIALQCSV